MSMGSKLAEARRKNNLTQEQLAERLGVTRQAVSRWESDTAYPETDKIVRMSRLLGVSCDWLLQDVSYCWSGSWAEAPMELMTNSVSPAMNSGTAVGRSALVMVTLIPIAPK